MGGRNISNEMMVVACQKVKEREFWINQLSGGPKNSGFPYDYPGKTMEKQGNGNFATLGFKFSSKTASKLLNLSKRNYHTLHMVLVAALNVLVHKYTNSSDVIMVTPIYKQDIDSQIIINTVLLLRNRLDKNTTFKEFLLQVRKTVLDAIEHYGYPVEILLDHLGIPFSYEEFRFPLSDITIWLDNIHKKEYIRHIHTNMNFSFSGNGDHIEGTVEYNTGLYHKSTIAGIIHHLQTVLHTVLLKPDTTLAGIDILGEDEKRRILIEFNNTGAEYPNEKTIHQLFEEQVKRTPDKTALVFEEKHLSYNRLNARANQVANLLRAKGVKADTVVGLMIDRSPELIIGLIGILKAGGAYLPIDTQYPENRKLTLLNDSRARFVLTRGKLASDISFTRLKNIFQSEKLPTITNPCQQIKDLNNLPMVNRTLINYQEYHKHIGQGMVRDSITLQATRGCPYNCAYCHKIWPKTHVFRSAENLFNEVNMYYDFGIRRFVFVDDIFNLDRRNSTRFFELIVKNGLKVHFHNPNGLRGDIMTKDYIDLMVEAGTVNISVALETASPRLQKLIGKNLNIDKLCDNLQYILDKHPHVTIELQTMHGFPTETEEEAMKTLNMIKSFKWIDIPYVHLLKIYPTTDMVKLALENGITKEAIERSADVAYHIYSETIPFPKSFTTRYQSILTNEYFLAKERLLAVLPRQMKILKEDEFIQKYNSYLPTEIKSFDDVLQLGGISRHELGHQEFLSEDFGSVPDFNIKARQRFGVTKPQKHALRILLLDLSMAFSRESLSIYDIADTPLGLMYLLTYLNKTFADTINGKIAKARIDFDSFAQLKTLLEDFKPEVIGLRTLTYFRNSFHKTVSLIRQWGFEGTIIAGGPYASCDYPYLLKDPNIDIVVLGEGELTLAEIIEKIMEHGNQLPPDDILEKINGIAFMKREDKKDLKNINREIIMLDELHDTLMMVPDQNPGTVNTAQNLAYVIYTSGTSGKPKGVMLEHKNLNNLMNFHFSGLDVDFSQRVFQFTTISFDVSFQEIFSTLLSGGELCLISSEKRMDIMELLEVIEKNKTNIVFFPASFLKVILNEEDYIDYFPGTVKHIITAGEQLVVTNRIRQYLKEQQVYLHNHYGPSETHVVTTLKLEPGEDIPQLPAIGKPIFNTKIYILNRENALLPIGVAGELFISGDNVGRGYLNNPENTSIKFVNDPLTPGLIMYKTGDLARWLPDGNIQFLGRKDQQVKIRGFRIELAEIESQLLNFEGIKEAAVIDKEDGNQEKYLCAFFVPASEFEIIELQEYLSRELPDYMIPRHFVPLDEIPLTTNGKVNRKHLSQLNVTPEGQDYSPPRDEIDARLVSIWSEILKINEKEISIDADFFELGGHSLKATILISKIHKAFNVKLKLTEIFNNPTIRGFSICINAASEDQFSILKPVEKRDYYVLSSAQNRLYILQQLDWKSTAYNLPQVITLEGKQDKEKLQETFKRLMKRHESLRTSFGDVEGKTLQRIHAYDDIEFAMSYYEANEDEARTTVDGFVRAFNLGKPPLFRAALIRLEEERQLLLVDIHHIISDGVSQMILPADFMKLYEGDQLPELRVQYKDFSVWQDSEKRKKALQHQEAYWLKQFSGGVPVLNLPADFLSPDSQSFEGRTESFILGKQFTQSLRKLVSHEETTLYMVLISIFNVFLSKLSGQQDIVVGTAVAGRRHSDLEKIIGMFVNTLPMRHYPADEKTFTAFLKEVKKQTLEAFENQEFQFEDLVDQVAKDRNTNRNPIFNVMFSLQSQEEISQDEPEADMNEKNPITYENKSAKFDLTFVALEKKDSISCSFEYSTKLFKEETIQRYIRNFNEIIAEVIENKNIQLKNIRISYDLLTVKQEVPQEEFAF
ncbi:MAG: condensation domain-containing protein [Candidatus Aminicenantes bacterium]|jgi:amino acid adenylation domain-containing protein